jgi:hypothetical protein
MTKAVLSPTPCETVSVEATTMVIASHLDDITSGIKLLEANANGRREAKTLLCGRVQVLDFGDGSERRQKISSLFVVHQALVATNDQENHYV